MQRLALRGNVVLPDEVFRRVFWAWERSLGVLKQAKRPASPLQILRGNRPGCAATGAASFVKHFCLLIFILLAFVNILIGKTLTSISSRADTLKDHLISQYAQLLMEKAICDDQGREIAGRLGRLIDQAQQKAFKSNEAVLNFILEELNYFKSNLGNFPPCAFDRPIGYKLNRFGHTKAPGDLEATAEGSACPVGGIGAGSFEWTISGNLRYWFLKSGWMVDDTIWADQFHIYIKSGEKIVAQTLSVDSPPSEELGGWRWHYPAGKGSYYALFPKSGFSYEKNPEFPARIAVVQFSPIMPHNYKETSYPVAVYKWIVENPNRGPIDVSIMLSWENMVGWEPSAKDPENHPADFVWDRKNEGNYNEFAEQGVFKGIVFRKKGADIKSGNALTGSMSIAARGIPGKATVYYQSDFDPRGMGDEIWGKFSSSGTLSNSKASRIAGKGEALAGALAVKFTLGPKERLEVPIAVAWDFPYYEFEKGVKYRKKYTEYFGAEGDRAFAIACEALDNYKEWEAAIDRWQKEIVGDPLLPDWLKQALFNELYILAETSIWDASTNLHSYLESADYLMYGTFDVDAYSSWHLLKFWPELELNNMMFVADTVPLQDPAYKSYSYAQEFPKEIPESKKSYYWNTNKVPGMVPHDLGSPRQRPWVVLNAFEWQNANVWKDLTPKFPLRAYRDFLYTGSTDLKFLGKMFRSAVIAMDTLEKRFCDPTSHLPLNEGIPDQTYDTWRMKGESAYVSMLWLAALKATSRMGQILLDHGLKEVDGTAIAAVREKYRIWSEAGRQAVGKLWNEKGGYFNIDASTDDIMTDQLFGVWYAKMTGLEEDEKAPIVPLDRARRSLRTIYEKNVLGFGGGIMGAVNGRTSSGGQLRSDQGDEVWAGTAYAYASNCILYGLLAEGLHTAYGVYQVTYSPYGQGYFFKTPEAYLNPEEFVWNNPQLKHGEKLFRAMKYMRPGAVWAVYEALLKIKR
jgi:non-lysosomal glucosylceramidase